MPGVAQPGLSWLRWGSFLDPLQVTTAWQTVPAQGMTGPSSALEGWISRVGGGKGRGWMRSGWAARHMGLVTCHLSTTLQEPLFVHLQNERRCCKDEMSVK